MSADEIKSAARRLGFDLVGIAPAVSPTSFERFRDWLDRCLDGEMRYLRGRREAYRHPENVLPKVQSVIMLGLNYRTEEPASSTSLSGRVSRYAWGTTDYHDLLRGKLRQLANTLHELHPRCRSRGVVDTAPLLERDFAQLAGLGWTAKNTMLINRQVGSWTFLAALLTDVELPYDAPHATSHCGTCTRCLEACPTDAFPEPFVLDANRCISYLTIELRGPIPDELREGMGDWLFGCDICQEVCPWNRRAPESEERTFQPRKDLHPADAVALLGMDDREFQQRFAATPLSRPGRAGLLRNAAIVLGNTGDPSAVPALISALQDKEPLIRGAAGWALGQLSGEPAQSALRSRRAVEEDAAVIQEIENALCSS